MAKFPDPNRFVVTDPEAQPGLCEEIEPGTRPIGYLNRYHTEHDVRCAFCAKHTPHRRGFTVELADGRMALCGIDCGRDFFGSEVARGFEKILAKKEADARRDWLLERARAGLPEILKEIDRHWKPLERRVQEVLRALPYIDPIVLRRHMTDGGVLAVDDVIVRWVELPDGSWAPLEERKLVARVQGAEILRMTRDRFMRVERHADEVITGRRSMYVALTLDQQLTARNAIPQAMKDAMFYLHTARAFLTKENIRELDKALRHILGAGWKVEMKGASTLRIRHADYQSARIELPDLSDLPDPDAYAAKMRAVED
jgi:hypothetical protein